ncbi:unnamed protein product, partial [Urochloa humidicola]
ADLTPPRNASSLSLSSPLPHIQIASGPPGGCGARGWRRRRVLLHPARSSSAPHPSSAAPSPLDRRPPLPTPASAPAAGPAASARATPLAACGGTWSRSSSRIREEHGALLRVCDAFSSDPNCLLRPDQIDGGQTWGASSSPWATSSPAATTSPDATVTSSPMDRSPDSCPWGDHGRLGILRMGGTPVVQMFEIKEVISWCLRSARYFLMWPDRIKLWL